MCGYVHALYRRRPRPWRPSVILPASTREILRHKKAVSGPSRGQDNGNESAEDIGRIREEEDGLNDNEFEEYGYLQGLPSDNEEDMPEEAGGDLEENLGVEPGEDSGDDMDEPGRLRSRIWLLELEYPE
ncbi:hypothetical protein FA13DRAFT_1720782 [Coprinellus micaceus]|uniref:Uncharacterized protein n=1 Tax=Coprinellus micaceus TaxID=71717 RepID=A0A4Y7S697_COPMI|nr:hypothetical protein FA13DRAFT_1720782 [Coprinellus micaceus]